jgi:hypothetical protein
MNNDTQAARILQPIDKLMRDLDSLTREKVRLDRGRVDELFLAMRREMPYCTPVITGALAATILADSPQLSTDTTLNEVVANLGKALSNPDAIDSLALTEQNYFTARKKTEKEYAVAIGTLLFQTHDVKQFPERAQTPLQELAYLLMEKMITEKQSRKILGYKSQSILELITPILQQRTHPEVERIKASQPQVFRQWLNNIAHEGYEKVNDEKKIAVVQQEKDSAFTAFRKAVKNKFPSADNLDKYLVTLRFLQNDRDLRHEKLDAQLDEFLDRKQPMLNKDLRERCHDKLRRLLNTADKNTEIYRSEETIESVHEQIFQEMSYEATAVKNIVAATTMIEDNYGKGLLQNFMGRKNLQLVKNAQLTALLGPEVMKLDPADKKNKLMREGGYPVKNLAEIYTTLIQTLESLSGSVSGMFADKLKREIDLAVEILSTERAQLKVVKLVPAEKPHVSEPVNTSSQHEVIPFRTAEESKAKAAPKVEEISAEIEIAKQPHAQAIEQSTEQFEVSEEEMKPAEVAQTPVVEKVEAPAAEELQEPDVGIEQSFTYSSDDDENFVLEPKEPTISGESEPDFENFKFETASHAVAKELQEPTETEFENFTLEPAAPLAPEETSEKVLAEKEILPEEETFNEEPTFNEESTAAETSAEVKPLIIPDDFSFDAEAFAPAAAILSIETPAPVSTPSPYEAGLSVMQNYQLGDFEEPIKAAWSKLMNAETSTLPGEEVAIAVNDNEVRLYVICDLAQQVAGIEESNLTPVNKEILQSVKELLLLALKDPTDESNWTFFEGPHRDEIDKAITGLRS